MQRIDLQKCDPHRRHEAFFQVRRALCPERVRSKQNDRPLRSSSSLLECPRAHDDVQMVPWCLPGASWCLLVPPCTHWLGPRPHLEPQKVPRILIKIHKGFPGYQKKTQEPPTMLCEPSSSAFFDSRALKNYRSCFLHGACGVSFLIFGTFYFPFCFNSMAVYFLFMFGLRLPLQEMLLKQMILQHFCFPAQPHFDV